MAEDSPEYREWDAWCRSYDGTRFAAGENMTRQAFLAGYRAAAARVLRDMQTAREKAFREFRSDDPGQYWRDDQAGRP